MTRHLPRSRTRTLVAALLAMVVSALFAAPLAAQTEQSDFEVLSVDLRGDSGLVAVRPAVSRFLTKEVFNAMLCNRAGGMRVGGGHLWL